MKSKKDEVLQYLQSIPKGKVVSYKILAQKFSTHPRAIAVFMKYNKYPDIYPCYKVVKDTGELSGYSGGNGVETKAERLRNDGVIIIDNKIDKKYFWFN